MIKELEKLAGERRRLVVPCIPAEPLRRIQQLVLFETVVPKLGNEATITAPLPLLRAAVDVAYREADGMRARKRELRTEAVQARLRRRVQEELAAL